MTDTQRALLIIGICVLCTFSERLLPFLLFRKGEVPKIVSYVGKHLPTAVILTLVVYCLRGVSFGSAGAFLPQIIAVAVTAALHAFVGNTLLSVVGGTAVCMVLTAFL